MNTLPQHAPEKQCAACKGFFPTTSEFFHRDKWSEDGWTSFCKQCRNSRRMERQKNPVPPGMKRCNLCKKDYPATLEYFHKWKGGLHSRCKTCRNQEHKEWYHSPGTHEHLLEQMKSYGRAHREEKRAYDQVYNQIHQEKKRAWQRIYNQTHQKERHARRHAYNCSPKGRMLRITIRRNRRARKKTISGIHTLAQIQDLLKRQKHTCYYCSAKFEKRAGKYLYHVDHTFPVSRVAGTDIPANGIDYLVLACPKCNKSKNNKFPWEWPEGGRLL